VIEAKGLSAGYRGREVIRGISLVIPDGGLTAIVGPNGCGKSTLVKALGSLIPVRSGCVLADGEDIQSIPHRELARRVSVLGQIHDTPDIQALRLVLHGRFPWIGYPRVCRSQDIAIAEEAMRRVGILELRGAPMASLSGGERQKVWIAMCLAQNTGSILLDEPTTYLDISAQMELMEILASLKNGGKAVCAVIHDLRLALGFADTVAVMKDGRLLSAGPPEETAASGVLEEAFGIQVTRSVQYSFTTGGV